MDVTNEKAKEFIEHIIKVDPHPIAYMYACWHDKENNSEQKVKDLMALAAEALGKQIPTKPIIKPWNAASCPCCGIHLSESLGDGYYKHWTSLKICECGQKLDWED